MLPRQHDVLRRSEEETRAALRAWADLQREWQLKVRAAAGWQGGGIGGGGGSAGAAEAAAAAAVALPPPAALAAAAARLQAAAAEEGAWLAHRLALQPEVDALLDDDEAAARRREIDGEVEAGRAELEAMAAFVRAGSGGGLFDADGTSRGSGATSSSSSGQSGHGAAAAAAAAARAPQQLEAIAGALFGPGPFRLRHEPYEWVYDGLSPALLPRALARRKGTALSLALAAAGVARRLGVAGARLVCAHDGGAPGVEDGARARALALC